MRELLRRHVRDLRRIWKLHELRGWLLRGDDWCLELRELHRGNFATRHWRLKLCKLPSWNLLRVSRSNYLFAMSGRYKLLRWGSFSTDPVHYQHVLLYRRVAMFRLSSENFFWGRGDNLRVLM